MGIYRKLKSPKGLTLVEMLVTIIIVLLMGGLLTTGMSLAVRSYTRSMRISHAQQLYGTLKSILTYELQYTPADSIETGANGEVTAFKSANFWVRNDKPSCLTVLKNENSPGGQLVFALVEDGVPSETAYNPILSAMSYPKGLGADAEITWYENRGTFTVNLKIYAGEELIMEEPFDVMNMGNHEGTGDDGGEGT